MESFNFNSFIKYIMSKTFWTTIFGGVVASFIFLLVSKFIFAVWDFFILGKFYNLFYGLSFGEYVLHLLHFNTIKFVNKSVAFSYNEFWGIQSNGQVIPLVQANGNIPFEKRNVAGSFFASNVASVCEIRAINYLAQTFGQMKYKTIICNDDNNDHSFVIALGGCNRKTIALMIRLNLTQQILIDKKSQIGNRYDCAFIIFGPLDRGRRTIVCAGLDEYGTSGSAYYLAHFWHEIIKERNKNLIDKKSPFYVVIKVLNGEDQESDIVECKKL